MERILIISAGPCGLACARELERLGHHGGIVWPGSPWVGPIRDTETKEG